jgi:putative hydrolase of the HAD superfamily
MSRDVAEPSALVVDWGGVLTSPLQDSMTAWCDADGIDYLAFRAVMKQWLGTSYSEDAAVNPIHALERGEMDVPDFERELGGRLRTFDGQPVEVDGLLTRMFAGFGPLPAMTEAVRHAKVAGLQTALLSNSWGNEYPREGWTELFDVVVISGEVGMRKPEPAIFRLTADRLGLAPESCVFVDDLMPNIRGAQEVGMIGVHHVSPQETIDQLEELFGIPMRG